LGSWSVLNASAAARLLTSYARVLVPPGASRSWKQSCAREIERTARLRASAVADPVRYRFFQKMSTTPPGTPDATRFWCMLKLADGALYQSKHVGRKRVTSTMITVEVG
jgi:hypothetical protein